MAVRARRWPARVGLAAAVLAAFLTLVGGGLWWQRDAVMTWAVESMLERQGLGPAAFTVDRVDLQGLHAHDVELAGGGIKAAELTLAFAPGDLLAGHLARIEVGGLDARMALGKSGLELNGRPISAAPDGAASGSWPLARLRIDALALREARIALETSRGRIEVLASAVIHLADGRLTATGVEAKINARIAGLSGPADAAVTGDMELDANGLLAKTVNLTLTVPVAGLSGSVKATIAGDIAATSASLRASDVKATITAPIAGLAHGAAIALKLMSWRISAPGGPFLTIAQASFAPKDLPWSAQGIDGEATSSGDKITAKLAIARLANLQKPSLVAPLKLAGTAGFAASRLDFSFTGATLTETAVKLQVQGRQDLGAKSLPGSATLAVGPVTFQRKAFQPGDLFPGLIGLAQDVDGSLALAGTLRWNATSITPDLTFTAKDLALSTPEADLTAINGAIKVNRLWPPATPPGQSLTALVKAAGLPPSKLSLTGQVLPKPALQVERIAMEIAGGEISAAALTLDPADPAIDANLKVNHVDLAEITRLLDIAGLTGTGRLDGQIPLSYKAGKLAIAGGKLAAREPGILSYRPSSLPPEVAQAGESVQLALQALTDFHYDRLGLDIDKAASGEGSVLLHLEGNNPAVLNGQMFNFNIRIESNFDRLADIALLSLRSASELLRRAAGRTGP